MSIILRMLFRRTLPIILICLTVSVMIGNSHDVVVLASSPQSIPPANTNLLKNPSFQNGTAGLANWVVSGAINATVNSGTLNLRFPTNINGWLYQTRTEYPLDAGLEIEATISVSNPGAEAKTFQLILSDTAHHETVQCNFIIPADSAFETYTLEFVTSQAWENLQVYFRPLSAADAGVNIGAVSVRYMPNLNISTKRCFIPKYTPPENYRIAFIGDSGYGDGFESVLNLILNENADAIVHLGDFDYAGNPDGFFEVIDSIMPANFPYFGAIGNNDRSDWNSDCDDTDGCYANFFVSRMQANNVDLDDPNLDDQMYAVSFNGVKLAFVGEEGEIAGRDIYAPYLNQTFQDDQHIWRFCGWHEPEYRMQLSSGASGLGWEIYEECINVGAIVGQGHEHMYARTKTLIDIENQVVDPTCASPTMACVGEGRTFAFISGLGGIHTLSDQDRCLPTTYPYGCNGEWAKIYGTDQNSKRGALFIEFNANGNLHSANGYFKNIDNEVIDTFSIVSDNQPALDYPPENTNLVNNPGFELGGDGELYWYDTGSINSVVTNGRVKLSFATTVDGWFNQNQTSYLVPAGTTLAASLEVTNPDSIAKEFQIMFLNENSSNQYSCSYTVPANASARVYTMWFHTHLDWNAIQIRIRPTQVDSNGLIFDNVSLTYDETVVEFDNRDCYPIVPPINTNLVYNPGFTKGANGDAGWRSEGNIISSVANNVMNLRFSSNVDGWLRQFRTAYPLKPQLKMVAWVNVSNPDSVPKTFQFMLRDSDLTNTYLCTFEVPANAPARNYYMRFKPMTDWAIIRIDIRPTVADANGLNFDNVNLRYRPWLSFTQKECISPTFSDEAPPLPPENELVRGNSRTAL